MIKTVFLLKKRPGMSTEEFRAYYENTHARIGERVLPTAERYFRRFLNPFPPPAPGQAVENDVDVITEIWFKDRATFDAAMAHLQEPAIAALIAADEENLFDRSKIRAFTVEERESSLTKP